MIYYETNFVNFNATENLHVSLQELRARRGRGLGCGDT